MAESSNTSWIVQAEKSRMRRIIFLSLLFSLCASDVDADNPEDRFLVSYEQISKKVLKDTKEIIRLCVSQCTKKPALKTYTLKGPTFRLKGKIPFRKTSPVVALDSWGIPSPDIPWACAMYPVTARRRKFIKLVYEPRKNKRAWVNIDALEECFGVQTIRLDRIKVPTKMFGDLTHFSGGITRKFYKFPRPNSPFKVLEAQGEYKVIDQKNGFIKLKNYFYVEGDESADYLWVKIRDHNGRLTIWFLYIDTC